MNYIPENIDAEIALYKSLLESTKAVPWRIDWASKKFDYLGPQIESLFGWSGNSLATVEDWTSRLHARDKKRVLDFYSADSLASATDHEIDYRLLKVDSFYVWVHEVVHVIKDNSGQISSLIGFMFDISETKKTEQDVLKLQKQLQEFSFKDGLTGVSNRRMFDTVLEEEWLQAQRNHQPLSLIMLDIDYFKQYNDCYGHVQGDDTLKRIAAVLNGACTRARDFFARYGGEEFALILPETDRAAAIKMAERCRSLIFKEQILHEQSEVSQILTISIGVDTIIPTHDDNQLTFIEAVDKLMYRAKAGGRNRIVHAE